MTTPAGKNEAAEVAADTEAKARNRQPSPFEPDVKITVAFHKDVTTGPSPTEFGDIIAQYFAAGNATRVVSHRRTKSDGTQSDGPASVMVYIAPMGYEFAAAKAEGAMAVLKGIAAKYNIDASDPAALLAFVQSLATKL